MYDKGRETANGDRDLGVLSVSISPPSSTGVALLLGLSLFLGLAFEDFFATDEPKRPGGIRTFPMLAFAGGILYVFDPAHLVPSTGGLIIFGIWLAIFYSRHLHEKDEGGETNAGLVVPVLNIQAYLLGAIALALPPWVAVTFTVAAVLLLTGREKLHDLARRGTTGMTNTALAAAVLIAASSNNVLKALYAAFFAGGRATAASAIVLVLLAAAGVVFAVLLAGL